MMIPGYGLQVRGSADQARDSDGRWAAGDAPSHTWGGSGPNRKVTTQDAIDASKSANEYSKAAVKLSRNATTKEGHTMASKAHFNAGSEHLWARGMIKAAGYPKGTSKTASQHQKLSSDHYDASDKHNALSQ